MLKQVELPECEKGEWRIRHFKVERIDFMAAMYGRMVPPGFVGTKLMRGDTVVMSDTPAEMRENYPAVWHATGKCLINGLGIGMVLRNILLNPAVTEVMVVELSQDLIDLVSPHYKDPRVRFVCADAYTYKPKKGVRFQMVWHDIWDTICADNLPLMAKLHRKYGRITDWQGSWAKNICQRERREELRYEKESRWLDAFRRKLRKDFA